MLTAEQNELLTRVEGDAPMGRMLRERYWIPCALSETLVADGAPQAVKLLGKTYVAFRASDGRVGFFDEACPHRGVSLLLARNEDCGLRCIFHAWKIDVSGKVVDVPSEGERAAAFAASVRFRSYPTFEGGGLLWTYLGDGPPPPRPPLPFIDLPSDRTWVSRSIAACNWFQGVEGTIDSIHVGTLHQSWIGKYRNAQASNITHTLSSHPRYEVDEAHYGIRAAAIRDVGGGQRYMRVTEWVMPFVSLVPGGAVDRRGSMFIAVPMDDVTHMLFWGFWDEDGPVDMGTEAKQRSEPRDVNNYARATPSREHGFGQDRAAMTAGHFSGYDKCLLDEDMIVQASMGAITDRTAEHLCSSDMALVRARQRLFSELRSFDQRLETVEYTAVVRPLDIVADHTFDWRGGSAKADQRIEA